MELILKSNDKQSIAKIIALAKELNIIVEEKKSETETNGINREALKEQILNFRATSESSFGDPVQWQREQREDRDIGAILENQKKLIELEGKIEIEETE
ncbi:MAG: hypothetical protein JWR50_3438 [Mucilaginibacter sp.]|nr:hypothetical protein [Mucilaginibacter sp.]